MNEATHRAGALMVRVSPSTFVYPLHLFPFLFAFHLPYLRWQLGSYFMYMSRIALFVEAMMRRSTKLETQCLEAEAQASDLEEELNVKSSIVEDLSKSNAIL